MVQFQAVGIVPSSLMDAAFSEESGVTKICAQSLYKNPSSHFLHSIDALSFAACVFAEQASVACVPEFQ
jgi:hypothetical protein